MVLTKSPNETKPTHLPYQTLLCYVQRTPSHPNTWLHCIVRPHQRPKEEPRRPNMLTTAAPVPPA